MNSTKDVNKLTSIDEHGSHIFLIPAEVKGFFRNHRTRVQWILMFIFLILPWITLNGKQLVLLNVTSREFTLFGILFRAHDAPLLFFLFLTAAFGIALVTAIWGRVWCGWACPQTVFIDGLYRKIELWTEGTYIERRKLQLDAWTAGKFRKKLMKWTLFVFVSSLISHSFIAYFTGSRELIKMIQGSPTENWTYFILVVFFTLLSLFNFAWFREQFCVIMCPYGRIQSVLMEPTSLAIVYDEKRGEPRKNANLKDTKFGDCVACNRCVEVCPTGIDIRNGIQMECIACTACVDACDDIMTKVKKPTGLISYRTLSGVPFKTFNFKSIIYSIIVLFGIIGLAYNIKNRDDVNITVLRALETPYTLSNDEQGRPVVINHFRLHFTNQIDSQSTYKIFLHEASAAKGIKLVIAQNPIKLERYQSETFHLFVHFDPSNLELGKPFEVKFYIQDLNNAVIERELTLIGPTK